MAVTLACQFIRANRNTPFAEPMLETLQSLEETFCDEQISIDFQALCERIRFFPSFEAIFDVEIFEAFRSAAQEQPWLTFYQRKPDPEAKAEKRRLAVLTLQLINGGWYAVGFDEERQAIWKFLLARVGGGGFCAGTRLAFEPGVPDAEEWQIGDDPGDGTEHRCATLAGRLVGGIRGVGTDRAAGEGRRDRGPNGRATWGGGR